MLNIIREKTLLPQGGLAAATAGCIRSGDASSVTSSLTVVPRSQACHSPRSPSALTLEAALQSGSCCFSASGPQPPVPRTHEYPRSAPSLLQGLLVRPGCGTRKDTPAGAASLCLSQLLGSFCAQPHPLSPPPRPPRGPARPPAAPPTCHCVLRGGHLAAGSCTSGSFAHLIPSTSVFPFVAPCGE